jgi:hypothetical protein
MGVSPEETTMLIDRYLAHFDVTEVHAVEVDAPPEVSYASIRQADLRDPLIQALFAVRELPNRIARRLRGDPAAPPPKSLTFADVATPEMGFIPLGEEPGVEFVVGSVGRFWKRDYGWKPVAAESFIAFAEPGYAKIAVAFSVQHNGFGRSILRYEARTATTDEVARARFRRYWRVIRPGVAIVMQRALGRIRAEAERHTQDESKSHLTHA